MTYAAASARLCVETFSRIIFRKTADAAASARLCVETYVAWCVDFGKPEAAASARLCVETSSLD